MSGRIPGETGELRQTANAATDRDAVDVGIRGAHSNLRINAARRDRQDGHAYQSRMLPIMQLA